MELLKRLWWRITYSRQGYVEKCRDLQTVAELKTLCVFFGLKLTDTRIWLVYDTPYNPIVPLSPNGGTLDHICKCTDTAKRRHELYWMMCAMGDITYRDQFALQCTPEWHDLTDWLHDR